MLKTSLLASLLVTRCAAAMAEDAVPSAPAEDPARLCSQAYRQENQAFVLEHCPEEAWALARAQCERNADSVSPRYAEFCHRFYSGTAPSYGH